MTVTKLWRKLMPQTVTAHCIQVHFWHRSHDLFRMLQAVTCQSKTIQSSSHSTARATQNHEHILSCLCSTDQRRVPTLTMTALHFTQTGDWSLKLPHHRHVDIMTVKTTILVPKKRASRVAARLAPSRNESACDKGMAIEGNNNDWHYFRYSTSKLPFPYTNPLKYNAHCWASPVTTCYLNMSALVNWLYHTDQRCHSKQCVKFPVWFKFAALQLQTGSRQHRDDCV